ncbi:MAG: DUF2336 domain-containing protein [Rhodospirillaceae bacterium]|nr:DUF2336 domain-containing protein [Rhodospirillaceae bacterium]
MVDSGLINAQELLTLARDRSREGRARLFQTLSDLFIGEDGRLNGRERGLISGIVDMLTGMVDVDIRQTLVRKLLAQRGGPAELHQILSRDVIEVAGPLLRASTKLSDEDLVDIVKALGRDHAAAIALRAALSEAVTDALIGCGEPNVVVAVLSNTGASLSQQSYRRVAADARRIEAYQRPLLLHRKLPPDVPLTLFWWVAAPLRRHILETVEIDAEVPDPDVVEIGPPPPDPGPVSPAVQEADTTLVATLQQTGQLTTQALLDFARSGRVPPLIAGIARTADLPLSLAQRACQDPGGEPLAVLCKVIELTRNDFASVFLMLRKQARKRDPLPPQALNELLGFYDRLARGRSVAIARRWADAPPPAADRPGPTGAAAARR